MAPFGAAEVPLSKGNGLGCDEEVIVVSRVGAAHFGVFLVEDNPHRAEFDWLVGESKTDGDSFVGRASWFR